MFGKLFEKQQQVQHETTARCTNLELFQVGLRTELFVAKDAMGWMGCPEFRDGNELMWIGPGACYKTEANQP